MIVTGPFRDGRLERGFVIVVVRLGITEGAVQVGAPLCGSHQARLNQREPVKEPGDVGTAARDERDAKVKVLCDRMWAGFRAVRPGWSVAWRGWQSGVISSCW